MATFTARLTACVRRGHLKVSDLHHWFERPRMTVRTWVVDRRVPREDPYGGNETERRLALLEQVVAAGHFPVPPDVNHLRRPHYVKDLRNHVARTSLPRRRPAA